MLRKINELTGKEFVLDHYATRKGFIQYLYDSNHIEGEEQYLCITHGVENKDWYLWDEWTQIGYEFTTLEALAIKFKSIIES